MRENVGNNNFCAFCGKPILEDAPFCPYCGKKIHTQRKPINVKHIAKIVRASTLVLLSFLMFIFAFFPVYTYSIDVEEFWGINIGLKEDIKCSEA